MSVDAKAPREALFHSDTSFASTVEDGRDN
jgi:hypothetical protein